MVSYLKANNICNQLRKGKQKINNLWFLVIRDESGVHKYKYWLLHMNIFRRILFIKKVKNMFTCNASVSKLVAKENVLDHNGFIFYE